jgi:hypothetical protein
MEIIHEEAICGSSVFRIRRQLTRNLFCTLQYRRFLPLSPVTELITAARCISPYVAKCRQKDKLYNITHIPCTIYSIVYLIPTDRTHGNKYTFYHSQYIVLNVWAYLIICRENSVTKKIICWCRGISSSNTQYKLVL